MRLAFSKALTCELTSTWGKPPVKTGQANPEKMDKLLGWWAKRLDDAHPRLSFGKTSGLSKHFPAAAAPKLQKPVPTGDDPLPPQETILVPREKPVEVADGASGTLAEAHDAALDASLAGKGSRKDNGSGNESPGRVPGSEGLPSVGDTVSLKKKISVVAADTEGRSHKKKLRGNGNVGDKVKVL